MSYWLRLRRPYRGYCSHYEKNGNFQDKSEQIRLLPEGYRFLFIISKEED